MAEKITITNSPQIMASYNLLTCKIHLRSESTHFNNFHNIPSLAKFAAVLPQSITVKLPYVQCSPAKFPFSSVLSIAQKYLGLLSSVFLFRLPPFPPLLIEPNGTESPKSKPVG
jgi:hypothetical protein